VVVNSVAHHFDEASAKRGTIDSSLIDKLEADLKARSPHKRCIALLHHHPIQHQLLGMADSDLMTHGERLLEVLATNGTGLVIHGHKHSPRLQPAEYSGKKMTIFAAGSLAAMSAHTLGSRNLFHILELPDTELPGCSLL